MESSDRTPKIVRTATAMLSVQGITWITSLVGVLVLPRFLGPSDFGLLASVGVAVMLMVLVAGFGTTNYLIKGTARTPERTSALVFDALAIRVGIWAALCLLILPPVLLLTNSNTLRIVMGVSAVGGFMQLAMDGFIAGFQGNLRFGRIAFLLSAAGILGQGALVLVVVLGGGVVGATLATTSLALISLLLVLITFLRTFHRPSRPTWISVRALLKIGPPYLAWDVGLRAYATLDIIMLPILVGSTTVGAYALAYRLVTIPVFATTIITMATYPALSAAAVQDTEWFRKVVTNAARLSFSVTAPMSAGLAVLAPSVVQLVSGDEFGEASILLMVLAVHIPAAAIHTVLGTSLFARDLQRRMAFVAWAAAAFNFSTNLIAIPMTEHFWGNGAIGAAATTVATEAMMGVFLWRWSWATIDSARLIGVVVRVCAAAAVMSICAAASFHIAGLVAAVLVGALVYAVSSFALGVVSTGEVRRASAALLRIRNAAPAGA